jgi:hypothetical protein
VRGFGARIRQSLALVTHLSCFLGVFGDPFSPPKDQAAAPG